MEVGNVCSCQGTFLYANVINVFCVLLLLSYSLLLLQLLLYFRLILFLFFIILLLFIIVIMIIIDFFNHCPYYLSSSSSPLSLSYFVLQLLLLISELSLSSLQRRPLAPTAVALTAAPRAPPRSASVLCQGGPPSGQTGSRSPLDNAWNIEAAGLFMALSSDDIPNLRPYFAALRESSIFIF